MYVQEIKPRVPWAKIVDNRKIKNKIVLSLTLLLD